MPDHDPSITTIVLSDAQIYALIEGATVHVYAGNLLLQAVHDPQATEQKPEMEFDAMTESVVVEPSVDQLNLSLKEERLLPLVEAGMLNPGDKLTWHLTKTDETYTVTVEPDGRLRAADGKLFWYPSSAASYARYGDHTIKGIPGWNSLRAPNGQMLTELREESGLWDAHKPGVRTSYRLREDWRELIDIARQLA